MRYLLIVGLLALGISPAYAEEAQYAPASAAQPQQLTDNMAGVPIYIQPQTYPPPYYAQPQPQPAATSQQPVEGEYGSSVMTDLRQLNF